MFNSVPNLVGPIVELVANSASLIVIFTEKGMGSHRKVLLFILLSTVIVCSLAKSSAYHVSSKSTQPHGDFVDVAVNEPFVIHGATLIKASDDEVYLRSFPSHKGNRLDILHKGAMATYEMSVIDENGRVWHRGSSNGNTGWMCSVWTVLQ